MGKIFLLVGILFASVACGASTTESYRKIPQLTPRARAELERFNRTQSTSVVALRENVSSAQLIRMMAKLQEARVAQQRDEQHYQNVHSTFHKIIGYPAAHDAEEQFMESAIKREFKRLTNKESSDIFEIMRIYSIMGSHGV